MSAFDDLRFLLQSESRVRALEVLSTGPHTRRELQDALDVSRPTVGRILDGFDVRGWVSDVERRYELTPLGEHVVRGVVSLLEMMETEARLRDVIDWLPVETPGFDIDLLADATVTAAEPASPYRPVERLMYLIRKSETQTIRVIGTRPPPGFFDAFDWHVEEGLRVEALLPPIVLEGLRRSPSEGLVEALETGRLQFRVCDDLPCGLTLLDGRIALCGYDQNTGMLTAVVDTDNPKAVSWAIRTYDRCRQRSELIDAAAFTI